MSYERAALLAQRPFDAQPVAVELIERRGERHRVFGRRQRRIVGLLVSADSIFGRYAARDDARQLARLHAAAVRVLVKIINLQAYRSGLGADDVFEQIAAHLPRERLERLTLGRRSLLIDDQDSFGSQR